MKVGVIGLGSMGKRRVRNLQALGYGGICGSDPREDRRAEAQQKYGIAVVPTAEQLLASDVDAVVISTPPDLHVPYADAAIEARVPFFTEAGVPDARLPGMIERMHAANVVGVPSSTMRYYPGPRRLRQIVESNAIGRPLLWIHHSGQYLPDWHPWETPDSYYVSKRETGGCREIVVFELVWLTQIFGPIERLVGTQAHVSDLALDIDDVYQLLLQHQGGVRGQLTVDVIARAPIRECRILGTEGVVEWQGMARRIRVYRASNRNWTEEALNLGTVEAGYVNPEEPYIDEMREFLLAATGKASAPYTYEEDLAILNVLLHAEQSGESGTWRSVHD